MAKMPNLKGAEVAILDDDVTVELRMECRDAWDAEELFKQIGRALKEGHLIIGAAPSAPVEDRVVQ